MTIGAKLHLEIDEDNFFDNIASTVAEFGFKNAQKKILNAEKRSALENNLSKTIS